MRLPHVRGGVSSTLLIGTLVGRSSPRPWGCFSRQPQWPRMATVFPTSVGVFLMPPRSTLYHGRSSPRPWGCFQVAAGDVGGFLVFPTSVGVFLQSSRTAVLMRSLPHVRGGVSPVLVVMVARAWSSPRPWGCFRDRLRLWRFLDVFPTSVGVFLARSSRWTLRCRLPHVRGGVSNRLYSSSRSSWSSPRPWGCFHGCAGLSAQDRVFPTSVGVFLRLGYQHDYADCLPHVRGGVSKGVSYNAGGRRSSPRPWGCFHCPHRP